MFSDSQHAGDVTQDEGIRNMSITCMIESELGVMRGDSSK